jgi:DNA processing protein
MFMEISCDHVSVREISSAYTFALAFCTGLGERSALKFYRCFPHYEDWSSSSEEQRAKLKTELGLRARLDVFSMNWEHLLDEACSQIDRNTRQGLSVLTIGDDAYPQLLRLIPDPPLVLFVKGKPASLSAAPTVAVVGTRHPTECGVQVASRISRSLASAGCCIVSGLALGIDTAAHQGALEGGGQTVAVFGTPLDKVYPADNKELARKILDFGGAWVSETPTGGSTRRNSFVLRDRIQSGLSAVVIPVQTDIGGGTMHTVRFAHKHFRLLFCPRPIVGEDDQPQYAGIHELLKSNVAKPFSGDDYQEIVRAAGERKRALLKGEQPGSRSAKPSNQNAEDSDLVTAHKNTTQLDEQIRKPRSKPFGQLDLF